ncbi:MAG: carboxypeptidase regulatory-like domain-containing protein [Deltaproteobacteria bacterium]|nr:carboxypeptidase regulatory-like domain-containing protein [Deltaproteobacteria bacterium]
MKRLLPLCLALAFSGCDCGLEPLDQIPDPPAPEPTPEPDPFGAVAGRVCGPDGVTWLSAASVWIEPEGEARLSTTSDGEGNYRLDGVPAGPQTLHIEKGSFATTRDVEIPAGETLLIPDDACELDLGPRIAVVRGSQYDNVEGVLQELGVQAEVIDVYQSDWAEQLLSDDEALLQYDILFLNCRSNEATYAERSDMQQRLRAFVEGGGSLHASDQAYDLIELTFPDMINFYGEDEVRGAADQGDSVDQLAAAVLDDNLQTALGHSVIDLHYGLSTWSAMVSVDDDVHVFIQADSPLLNGQVLEDAPQLVGFDHGAGRVIYSSFHQEPGIGVDQEQVVRLILFEL